MVAWPGGWGACSSSNSLLDPSHVFQMREDGSMVPTSEAALESLRLLVEEGLQPMRM